MPNIILIFDIFIAFQVWDRLIAETDRYAQQQLGAHPPAPTAPRWSPPSKEQMKAFFGLLFTMGIMKLPSRKDYWSTTSLFRTEVASIMSRNRFNALWRYLHLQDNTVNPPARDPLWKLRWLLDHLNRQFQDAYLPYGVVSVDETMVKNKSRFAFKQYMPMKPTKWGVKVWTLAEASTGYAYNFQVYTGRVDGRTELGLGGRVVTDLVEPLLGTNVQVYMDNYFTSVGLMEHLRARGILACGTIRSNRKGLLPQLRPANVRLNKHDYRVAQKNDIVFSVWKDTKSVLTISNFHDPRDVGTVRRKVARVGRQDVRVPKMVADYQKNMKGVDLLDQMTGYYVPDVRSRKWWRRLLHHLMMMTAYNAYIIAKDQGYASVGERWPDFKAYLKCLASDLVGDVRTDREAPVPRNVLRAVACHELYRAYEKKKTCRECSLSNPACVRAQQSHFACRQCGVPLHQHCLAAHMRRAALN